MSNYNVTMTLGNIRAITVMFLDIFIMWFVLYYALKIIRSNARTIQIFKGILLIIIIDAIAKFFGLKTLAYLTDIFINWGFLAIIIIFQPEIRSLLERMGKTNVFSRITTLTGNEKEKLVDEIVTATMLLSKDQTGALISIEQNHPLDDFVATGTLLNSDVTAELLTSIFVTSTPLHDGAIIIQGDKIACASAYFPPTNLDLPSRYGARHRAAIGISEITDAVTIIVSEETGAISITEGGKIFTVDRKQLRNYLLRVICGEETEVKVETHHAASKARKEALEKEQASKKEKAEKLEDTSVISKISLKKQDRNTEEMKVIVDDEKAAESTQDLHMKELEKEAKAIKLPRKKARPAPSYPTTSKKQKEKRMKLKEAAKEIVVEKEEQAHQEELQKQKEQELKAPAMPKKQVKPVEKKQPVKPVVEEVIEVVPPVVEPIKPVEEIEVPQAPRMSAEDVKAARERTKEILAGKTMEIKTTDDVVVTNESKDEKPSTKRQEGSKKEKESPYDATKLDFSKIVGMDDELDKTFEMIDSIQAKKASKKEKGGE